VLPRLLLLALPWLLLSMLALRWLLLLPRLSLLLLALPWLLLSMLVLALRWLLLLPRLSLLELDLELDFDGECGSASGSVWDSQSVLELESESEWPPVTPIRGSFRPSQRNSHRLVHGY
jgi:hypothetical protein